MDKSLYEDSYDEISKESKKEIDALNSKIENIKKEENIKKNKEMATLDSAKKEYIDKLYDIEEKSTLDFQKKILPLFKKKRKSIESLIKKLEGKNKTKNTLEELEIFEEVFVREIEEIEISRINLIREIAKSEANRVILTINKDKNKDTDKYIAVCKNKIKFDESHIEGLRKALSFYRESLFYETKKNSKTEELRLLDFQISQIEKTYPLGTKKKKTLSKDKK